MSFTKNIICAVVTASLVLSLSSGVMAQKSSSKDKDKKREKQTSFSVLDSTEAQWGRRSINDSIYRGYTVNAVYLERGRQRLPDSFNMYKPQPIGAENVIGSEDESPTTTIRVNGKEQKLIAPEE